MSVMIGIDPHKLLHAACAIDRTEVELGQLQVRSGPRQLSELLAWAAPFESRTWAIESAGGLGHLLAQQLVARGECVVDVPATLSARLRVLGSGRSNKNDANDARAVAIAALRSASVASVRAEDHTSVLRLLAKAQLDASRARSRACSRLHALVRELVPAAWAYRFQPNVSANLRRRQQGIDPAVAARAHRVGPTPAHTHTAVPTREHETGDGSIHDRLARPASRGARPPPAPAGSAVT